MRKEKQPKNETGHRDKIIHRQTDIQTDRDRQKKEISPYMYVHIWNSVKGVESLS